MNPFSRIFDWLSTWYNPVPASMVAALQKASKQASANDAEAKPYKYDLFTGREQVYIRSSNPFSFNHWTNRVIYFIQGRPLQVTLYQKDVTGFIGPFAKARKYNRANNQVKENALMFWPAPGDKIDPEKTKYVLKVGVGDATLAREIRMMRVVGEGLGITPNMVGYSPDLKWHLLDFIGNAKKEDPTTQSEIYLDHIAKIYFDFWTMKTVSVRKYLAKNNISKAEFLKVADQFQIKNAEKLLDGKLTTSITHGGGIPEECLLTDDGQPYFLDWEKATLAPVGEDFIQVFLYRPDQTLEVFSALIDKDALPAQDQIAIALIRRYSLNNRKARKNPKKVKQDYKVAELLRNISTS